ncbi:MAG TPA: exonuclease domain-containing protein [Flavobacterium sp.]|nr:exonuclease domain-containing protein [Flavobacterium sp.]
MNFLAIDVETANADYSSICQIGIAEFKNGEIIDKWKVLINPEDYFDPFNVSIHGISEKDVKNAPTFKQVYEELNNRLNGKITIHHMPFDRIAINRACDCYNLEHTSPKWLDSAKIVRRTWTDFAHSGYGLSNIAKHLNISFEHHDALEDAITAGIVVVKASIMSNLTIEEWFKRVGQPIFNYKKGSSSIYLEENPEGQFYGENIVFTGALSIPRSEAGIIASKIGCKVTNSVTKTTTMLVVGLQDDTKLAGYEKSSKHRKAEELIEKGISIRILSENDFVEICNLSENE